jgi:hypothetical protein
MIDKPSRNEEEYFKQQEADLQRRRRERAAQEAERKARLSHYMKCPKCGADLAVEIYKCIEVDRCPECNGVWFDAGEVEALTETQQGTASALFQSIIRGVRAK